MLQRLFSFLRAFLLKPSLPDISMTQLQFPFASLDLNEAFDKVNLRYFAGQLKISIAWSKHNAKKCRRYRTLGSYCSVKKHIKIHPILKKCPDFFLEYVIYHEMLHHVLPPKKDCLGRRYVHHAEFKQQEKLFPDFEKAKKWEQDNMKILLQAIK